MGTSQKARRGNRAVQDNPESGMASQSFKKGNVSYVTGKSRKRVSTESHYAPSNASAPTVNPSTAQSPPSKKLKGDKKIQESEAPFERRLRRWRAHPPKTYLERLFRIQHTRYRTKIPPVPLVRWGLPTNPDIQDVYCRSAFRWY